MECHCYLYKSRASHQDTLHNCVKESITLFGSQVSHQVLLQMKSSCFRGLRCTRPLAIDLAALLFLRGYTYPSPSLPPPDKATSCRPCSTSLSTRIYVPYPSPPPMRPPAIDLVTLLFQQGHTYHRIGHVSVLPALLCHKTSAMPAKG